MFYLRYLCLFAYSGIQHISCCVFVLISSSCVSYVANFSFLIAPSVFSNVYLQKLYKSYKNISMNTYSVVRKHKQFSEVDLAHIKHLKVKASGDYRKDTRSICDTICSLRSMLWDMEPFIELLIDFINISPLDCFSRKVLWLMMFSTYILRYI